LRWKWEEGEEKGKEKVSVELEGKEGELELGLKEEEGGVEGSDELELGLPPMLQKKKAKKRGASVNWVGRREEEAEESR